MMKENKQKEYFLNAQNFTLGRLAAKVAVLLMGKNEPHFKPNKVSNNKVIIYNFNKIKITGNKLKQKIYYRHTGFLGHLKSLNLENLFKKNPKKVLEKVVKGMLPKNKLRDRMMKNLKVYLGGLPKN